MERIPTLAPGPAPATPDPGAGQPGPAAKPADPGLNAAHADVVSRHAPRAANAGSFKPGGKPWNAGGKGGVAPAAGADPGAAPPGAVAPVVPGIEPSAVRELVEIGFGALDETLKLNLAQGWHQLTGDANFSRDQAEFHGLKTKQIQAIGVCAELCAAKYGAAIQYLPELGLAVAVGGYSVAWVIAFNKLRQAAALKAKAEKKEEPAKPPALA